MEDKIDKIERELIEQEHRPFKVIANYIYRKRKWPEDLKKQNATKVAFLWRIFFSPAVVASVGGLIALLTLGTLVWQNRIIEEQNEYFRQQLTADDLARFESIFLSETESVSRRERAVLNYLRTSKLIYSEKNSRISLAGANLNECRFFNQKELFRNIDFTDVSVENLAFVDTDLTNSRFTNLKRPFENPVWGFTGCDLSKTVFEGYDFTNIVFYNSTLRGSTLLDVTKSAYAPVFIDCEKVYDSVQKNPFLLGHDWEPFFSLDDIQGRYYIVLTQEVRTLKKLERAQSDLIEWRKHIRENFDKKYSGKVSNDTYLKLAKDLADTLNNSPYQLLLDNINNQLKLIRLSKKPKQFLKKGE